MSVDVLAARPPVAAAGGGGEDDGDGRLDGDTAARCFPLEVAMCVFVP
jgi:hypothetical protein